MKISSPSCPVCGSQTAQMPLIEIQDMPVFCNVLLPDRESALRAPKGDIHLVFCGYCGHLYNKAFDPRKAQYSPGYENSLHFSPRFQAYAESLAKRLVHQYQLQGKTIIEIGCGKGDFLNLLCKMGENRGFGFDPSYEEERVSESDRRRFVVIRDFYSEKYAEIKADMIVCRHVLEHIMSPRSFLESLRKAVGDRGTTVFFFEVPNAMYTLKDLGIWDLIYEHCGYFISASLAHVFEASDLFPVSVNSDFGGQYICIEAMPDKKRRHAAEINKGDLSEVAGCAKGFAREHQNKVMEWHERLRAMNQNGKRFVVWGAGSKGVTFLNLMGKDATIKYVVDINPHKKGFYVPGTGQEVIGLQDLKVIHPDVIIIMNPLYEREILEMLRGLNISCAIARA